MPPWFTRHHWDYEAAFGPDPRWGRWQDAPGIGPAEHAVLSRIDQTLGRRLTAFGKGSDRYGLVHTDLRLANLIVDGDATTVIDFDDSGFSWYLNDLGGALGFLENHPDVDAMIASWLRGYRRFLDLPAEDEWEIPTLMLYRRMTLLAWMGSHPNTDTAAEFGTGFATATCEVAERYLRDARLTPISAQALVLGERQEVVLGERQRIGSQPVRARGLAEAGAGTAPAQSRPHCCGEVQGREARDHQRRDGDRLALDAREGRLREREQRQRVEEEQASLTAVEQLSDPSAIATLALHCTTVPRFARLPPVGRRENGAPLAGLPVPRGRGVVEVGPQRQIRDVGFTLVDARRRERGGGDLAERRDPDVATAARVVDDLPHHLRP